MNILLIFAIFCTTFVRWMATSENTVDSMEPDFPICFADHNECQSTRNGSEYQICSNELIVSLKDNPPENALNEKRVMCHVQIFGTKNEIEFEFIAQNGAKYKYRDICDLDETGIVYRHSILDLCVDDMEIILLHYNNTQIDDPPVFSQYLPCTMLMDTEHSTSASSSRMISHSDRLEIYYEKHNPFEDKLDHSVVANQCMVKFVFLGIIILSMVMVTRFKRATKDKYIESNGSMSRTRIMWYGFISSIVAAMTRYFSLGIDR